MMQIFDAAENDPAGRAPILSLRGQPIGVLLIVGVIVTPQHLAAQEQPTNVVPSDRSTIVQRADRSRIKGDSTRPLTIVEISDFQCPFCQEYFQKTYPVIDSLYVDTGKAQYIFMIYPNPSHSRARPAAEAAYCAGAAGLFWPMHDKLFENQKEWSRAEDPLETFVRYAEELRIDTASFRRCLEQDLASQIQVRDLEQVSQNRISSTPFFIINRSTAIRGAQPLDRFKSVLDSVLNAQMNTDSE